MLLARSHAAKDPEILMLRHEVAVLARQAGRHGGAGYTKDFPVGRYMREAKVMQIFDGTNQIHRFVISRDLVGCDDCVRLDAAGRVERASVLCPAARCPSGQGSPDCPGAKEPPASANLRLRSGNDLAPGRLV